MLQDKGCWFLLVTVCVMMRYQQVNAGTHCKETKDCPYYEICRLDVESGLCMWGCDDLHYCRFSLSGYYCHPVYEDCSECIYTSQCPKGKICSSFGECEPAPH
ncbi:uncharacterized protein LOC142344273 [Convolutriloba macropyga]|uniref:uncharacterized protein LOC142344273 n=1 Tax=Convolutriloba macropyga TaxID=536237 RepID=UPI003F51B515